MNYERLVSGAILRPNDDGSITSIPPDERNSDYRVYLAWVAAGNEAPIRPEPIPEPAPPAPPTRAEYTKLQDQLIASNEVMDEMISIVFGG